MNLDGSVLTPTLVGSHFLTYIKRACGVAVNSSHVYWADKERDVIGRAGLDGSEVEYFFIKGADDPCGVALDDSHVYWANTGGDSIGRADLDGSDRDQDIINTSAPCGVAVDDKFIYWAGMTDGFIGRALLLGPTVGPHLVEADEGSGHLCGVAVNDEHLFWGGYSDSIGRVGIDGAEPEAEFLTGVEAPCGIAVDDDHLYWTEEKVVSGVVGRAELDGDSVDRSVVTGLHLPCGVAVDSRAFSPPAPPAPRPAPACVIEGAKFNKRRGIAFAALGAPAHGEIRVLTRGLHSRVLGKEPPPNAGGYRQWWIKLRPRAKGKVARRIKRQLRRRGRARVNLRVFCAEDGNPTPAYAKRRIVLRKKKVRRAKGKRTARRLRDGRPGVAVGRAEAIAPAR